MTNSNLEQTNWNCQYHIAFAPAIRNQVLYGRIKAEIVEILSALCKQREIEILVAEPFPNYLYLLLSIPPKISVSTAVGYLKGKSALVIFDQYEHLHYKRGSRHFWCRGFYVDTTEQNRQAIEEYIRNQLEEDRAADPVSVNQLINPLTGWPPNNNGI